MDEQTAESSTLSIPRPTTDAELLELTEYYLGVRVPNKACCHGHAAPAKAFCDAYFARTPFAIWKAARGLGGKSFLLAALSWMESVTLRASVTILGGSGHQSANVHEYLRTFWLRPTAPAEALKDDTTAAHARLIWGNTVRALTASQTSVRGPHPHRVRMDEVDEMEWAICSAARGQAMSRDDIPANTVFSSTHQNADGTLTKLLMEAAEKGMPVYEWSTMQGTPVLTRSGYKPIERLDVDSDEVLTRSGWRRLQHVTLMGMKPVMTVACSDGAVLNVTRDHRVATTDGWVRAEHLSVGSTLLGLSRPSFLAETAVPSIVRASVSIFGSVFVPRSAVGACDLCGNMGRALHVYAMRDGLDVLGMRSNAGAITTDMIEFVPGRDVSDEQFVGESMRTLLATPGVDDAISASDRATGPSPAAIRLDGDSRHDVVDVVDDLSTGILIRHVVSISHGAILVPVWDIGVEGDHEFVANGIIVHNCYKETLAPHGWLTDAAMQRFRTQLTAETWRVEVELGEPSPEGRAIMPECVEAMFSLANEKYGAKAKEEIRDPEGQYFEFEDPVPGAQYATGADWGSKGDETVIWTWRCDCYPMRLVAYEHLTRRPMPWMIERLMARLKKFPGDAFHDATGVGTYHADSFTEPVDDYVMVGKKRNDLFVNYITDIENGACAAPRILSAYHAHKYARNKDLYGAEAARESGQPKGHPPDPLVAAAMAYAAALNARHPLALANTSVKGPTLQAQNTGQPATSALRTLTSMMRKKD